jgi:hypothetical protein
LMAEFAILTTMHRAVITSLRESVCRKVFNAVGF